MPKTFTEILLDRLAQDVPALPQELMAAFAPRENQSEPSLQEIITRHLGEALSALPKPQESDPFDDA